MIPSAMAARSSAAQAMLFGGQQRAAIALAESGGDEKRARRCDLFEQLPGREETSPLGRISSSTMRCGACRQASENVFEEVHFHACAG